MLVISHNINGPIHSNETLHIKFKLITGLATYNRENYIAETSAYS